MGFSSSLVLDFAAVAVAGVGGACSCHSPLAVQVVLDRSARAAALDRDFMVRCWPPQSIGFGEVTSTAVERRSESCSPENDGLTSPSAARAVHLAGEGRVMWLPEMNGPTKRELARALAELTRAPPRHVQVWCRGCLANPAVVI